jgi:uncharacterized protein (TIGR02145 family)
MEFLEKTLKYQLLLIIIIISCTSCTSDYEEGQKHFEKGELNIAESYFIEINPDDKNFEAAQEKLAAINRLKYISYINKAEEEINSANYTKAKEILDNINISKVKDTEIYFELQEKIANASELLSLKEKDLLVQKESINQLRSKKQEFISSIVAGKNDKYRASIDDFNDVVFIYDKRTKETVSNQVYLYLATKEGIKPTLRFRIESIGSRYIFIKNYEIKTDSYKYDAPAVDLKRDYESGFAFEIRDVVPSYSELIMIKDIINSDKVQIRFNGANRSYNSEISHEEQQAIRSIYELYEFLDDDTRLTLAGSDDFFSDGEESIISEVTIGDQVWMAKNYSPKRFRNGEVIPYLSSKKEWTDAVEKKQPGWSYPNNESGNEPIYGILYNWFAITDPRGILPDGWKVPSSSDWEKLNKHLGGSEISGEKLKSRQGKFIKVTLKSETGISGFDGLPSGSRGSDGSFSKPGYFGNWWSTTTTEDNRVYVYGISTYDSKLDGSPGTKGEGFSIRGIKAEGVTYGNSSQSNSKNSAISTKDQSDPRLKTNLKKIERK